MAVEPPSVFTDPYEASRAGRAGVSGSVYEAFGRSLRRYPDNEFLCVLPGTARKYGIEARSFSYQQASVEIDDLRSRYAAAGLGQGHRVGLLLENSPAMFFHWFALNALGVCVVPINPELRSAELEFLVGHSEIGVAVAPVGREITLSRAASSVGCRVVVTSPDLSSLANVAFELQGGPDPGRVHGRTTVQAPGRQSECALLYTSGTTGAPKGCILTNEYFLWAGSWYAQAGGLCDLRDGVERLVSPLPMSHMNAMACSTMAMLLTGGCIVPLDRFHPGSWWRSVRESRASIIHYLGVMPAMLLSAPPSAEDRDHTVRFGFGAGVSPRLHAAFESRFGFPLLEAWAMTETGAGAAMIANREPRKVGTACFGRAQPLVDFRVVKEDGKDASAGEHGELWVRSAARDPRFGFFREYLKDPQATSDAWEGGYFHTGDIVFADADGDLHFVDRKKNVIRRSGENISAVEVESVLLQHPGVLTVGVAAVPDEVRGDEVMACIVSRNGPVEGERVAFARELQSFCLERLAYFKAPGYVSFCTELPLTSTEKIQRARLKALARELLAAPTTVDVRAFKKRTASV